MVYNFTNITLANNTAQLLSSINIDLSGGTMFLFFSLVIFSILLVYNSEGRSIAGTLLISSFITSILTSLMFLAGLVALKVVITFIIITVIAVVLIIFIDK